MRELDAGPESLAGLWLPEASFRPPEAPLSGPGAGGLSGLQLTPSPAPPLDTLASLGGGSNTDSGSLQQLLSGTTDASWSAAFDLPLLGNDDLPLDLGMLGFGGGQAAGNNLGAGGFAPPPAAPEAAAAEGSGEDRGEKARAQNRAKQARFRQRQKEKKEDMAQRFEAAEADLEREKALNESMRQSGALFEGMKTQKDAAVAVLEQAAAAGGGGGGGPGAQAQAQQPRQQQQAGTGGLYSGSTLGTLGTLGGGGSPADRICQLPFQERVDMCCALFQSTESAAVILSQEAGEGVDGFALNADVRRQVSLSFVEAHPQVLEAALAMSAEDVLEDWAEFGQFTGEVLRQLDGGHISEAQAEERLRPAVMYQTILHALLVIHRPEHEHALLQHTRFPGETEEQEAERWRSAMVDMCVSEEQARRCLPHYKTYCTRMGQLGQEAASSLASMQEVQQTLDTQLQQLGDASLSSMVQQYLGLYEATSKLKQQPTAALLILEDFFAAAGASVSPLQKARMTAACTPLHPDVPAIVKAGLEQYGLLPPEGGTSGPAARAPAPAVKGRG